MPLEEPSVMNRPRRTVRESTATAAVPEATVARLPIYLRVLTLLAEDGVTTVSSDTLAAGAGMTPAKVRKDLSHLGSYGTRGVGYDVDVLLERISARLGLTEDRAVLLAGVGNLGHALARYGGFQARGFRIVALVDADPDRAGEVVGEVEVRPVDELERLIEDCQVTIGMICTPAGAAQQVCDRLVAAGVTSILNFAPVVLSVPEGVDVRKVDLAVELQILSFHEARKRTGVPPGPARPGAPAGSTTGSAPDGLQARTGEARPGGRPSARSASARRALPDAPPRGWPGGRVRPVAAGTLPEGPSAGGAAAPSTGGGADGAVARTGRGVSSVSSGTPAAAVDVGDGGVADGVTGGAGTGGGSAGEDLRAGGAMTPAGTGSEGS
jgi:redox-sensing transcriptional repressor